MSGLTGWGDVRLINQPEFAKAWRYAAERGLVNLDPWSIFTSREQVDARTLALNGRYPERQVLCFAERQDTDDVACIVLAADSRHSVGSILLVHDFATSGSEVDAVFADFWEWFKAAVDDLIDVFRHMPDAF